MRRRRLIILISVSAVVVLALLGGRFADLPRGGPAQGGAAAQARSPRQVAAVTTEVVGLAEMSESATATGTLVSQQTVIVRPEIAGRIAGLGFNDGQHVRRGEVLVRLDDSVLRAELAQAEATLSAAQANAGRAADLHARGFLASRALESAQAELRTVSANVALARARLAQTVVRAPFSGQVGLRRAEVGDYAAAGQDIVNLERIDTLKVDFRLPQALATRVSPGTALALSTSDGALDGVPARVTAVDPLVDRAGRSLLVRAAIDNPAGALRPGQLVTVSVILQTRPNAVVVSENAIVPQAGRQNVYRVMNGRATLTQVTLGMRREGRVEIASGLSAGDRVVVLGHERLSEGAPVFEATPPRRGQARA